MDGRTDGWMYRPSYRDAWMHPKDSSLNTQDLICCTSVETQGHWSNSVRKLEFVSDLGFLAVLVISPSLLKVLVERTQLYSHWFVNLLLCLVTFVSCKPVMQDGSMDRQTD